MKDVQRALVAAKIAVDQDGIYRPSTAAAVAHFQKEQRINVNGVVDVVTQQRLGVAAATPR
ncbi:MAG TPA: peptidoglycan-binding domain-containing protein [Stellaceae bacterium]|nr:peptidoglycan-binding domain-containing protein [Stellaceae bacterium]